MHANANCTIHIHRTAGCRHDGGPGSPPPVFLFREGAVLWCISSLVPALEPPDEASVIQDANEPRHRVTPIVKRRAKIKPTTTPASDTPGSHRGKRRIPARPPDSIRHQWRRAFPDHTPLSRAPGWTCFDGAQVPWGIGRRIARRGDVQQTPRRIKLRYERDWILKVCVVAHS